MSYSITKIEGIGKEYAKKLQKVDIQTTDDLLRRGGDQKGRQGLAKESGVSEKLILEWVNLSDLMRIKGVGEEFADLLEEAGVDTVKELAGRSLENLHEALKKANAKRKLARRLPGVKTLGKWVAEAKKLKPGVTH